MILRRKYLKAMTLIEDLFKYFESLENYLFHRDNNSIVVMFIITSKVALAFSPDIV